MGTLIRLLLGFFFAMAGMLLALETAVPTYTDWQAMKNWQSTTAHLVTVELSENKTEAKYHYTIANKEYQNDRVSVASFSDNIGSYQQQMYQRLQQNKVNNQAISIWYNPANPEQTVIDREMRWGFFALIIGFCSVLVIIGIAVILAGFKKNKPGAKSAKIWEQYQAKKNSTRHLAVKTHPRFQQYSQQNVSLNTLPTCLNNKEWRNNRIRSGSKSAMIGIWFFAIIWIAISSTPLLMLETELNNQNYAALLVLLFPLVGLFLLKKAWDMTREWLRFGVIELEMDPFPGSIGGHVGGSLLIKNTRDFNAKYQIELACVHSYETGSGKNKSRNEDIKWAETGIAKAVAATDGILLRFRFDVPENLPESDIERSRDYYFWRLKLSTKLSGIELNRGYNILVFNTHQQSAKIKHNLSAQAEAVREQKGLKSQAAINRGDFANTVLARALRYKDEGKQQVFYFPMFRNKVLTLIALVFAGGFGFAAYSINQGFFDQGIMDWLMLIFSIPFSLVALFAGIAAIYLPLNNLTTILTSRQIATRRRLFIFPVKKDIIPAQNIQRIEIKSSGSTGQGTQMTKHFKLIVHSKKHKKVTIAEDIDGEQIAEQLKEFISNRLLI